MEALISNLVSRFEKGSLSRRDLVQTLALLAAGGSGIGRAAAAQEELDFKTADISHVSIHVADPQRSIQFYQRMFGFRIVSQDQAQGVIRLGNDKVLVSLNSGAGRAGSIDHFAIGIAKFDAPSGRQYFTQRGAMPSQGDYAGFHIKDPDGVNVQIDQR